MDVVFTESQQLGLTQDVTFRFERELVEMATILGRPLPELRGARLF